MKRQVNIAFVGFGVVGSGTLQLFKEHRREVEARVGAKIYVKWVCSRHKKKSTWFDKGTQQTTDWKKVVADPDVDCVVELIGGTDPAKKLILSALQNGKHVITANKAVLSKYWNEIFGMAHKKRRLVYFEAAVGGGVPVVQALNEGLAGNKINKIIGILNGTTNFILTKMQETGVSFDEALKDAQAAGFAEANPAFDIDGIDAAQKLSILGSLATGSWVSPDDVYMEGISKLQSHDIRVIEGRYKSRVKLVGLAEESPRGWIFRVHPTIISQTHPFANVRNEYNAISLHGNAVGDVMLSGKGAGKLATSSAVVSDLIFLCRHIANGTAGVLPYVSSNNHRGVKLAPMSNVVCRYYLRITTLDRPGLLSRITSILGRNRISIDSVHQDSFEHAKEGKGVPIVFLTHRCKESDVQKAIRTIDRLPTTISKTVLLRME